MIKYTLEYNMPSSPATRDDSHSNVFEARDDAHAILRGKELILDDLGKGDIIPEGTVLTKIYRTPINLLEKSFRVHHNYGRRKNYLKEI